MIVRSKVLLAIALFILVLTLFPRGVVSAQVSFSFNETSAVGFYNQLSTSTGLEVDYPGSYTIWLSDDQALDYHALLNMYNSTRDSDALKLAKQINSSIVQWGGFYEYWNPVFEVIGSYPDSTQVMCGTDMTIGASQGYTIKTTVFKFCPGFQYSFFADLLSYHVLLDLQTKDYTGAESEFGTLSKMWDGHGFVDQPFQDDTSHTYQSYKLATYVIAWKALDGNAITQQFAQSYLSTVNYVASIMASLQSDGSSGWAGGVWTGYRFSNGQLIYGKTVSLENGETTSLFVLAMLFPIPEFPPASFVVLAMAVSGVTMLIMRYSARKSFRSHKPKT